MDHRRTDVEAGDPKEFTVPAQGVLLSGLRGRVQLKEDRWIERPGFAGQQGVHHAVVFLQGPGDHWLCTYVPAPL